MWRLETLTGETVWSGEVQISPRQLSQLLCKLTCTSEEITYFTLQIIRNSSTKSLPHLLNILTCFLNKGSDETDISILSSLDSSNTSFICGKPLKKGDIVWTCRQCGHDPSCVQCNECFQQSNHQNHEVFFYKSSGGGGCCDCGDTEAWKEEGCCSKHRTNETAKSIDPLSLLPPNIITGYKAVLDAIILFFYSILIGEMEGFTNLTDRFNLGDARGHEMVIRLHNDDIHSYDDVISALREIGLTDAEAEQKTVAVDKAGYAIVRRHADPDLLESNWKTLAEEASLLVSVIPLDLCTYEEKMSGTWTWMHQTTAKNIGLLRLLTNAIVEPIENLYSRIPSQIVQYLSRPSLVYPHLPIRHVSNHTPPYEVVLPVGVDGTPPDQEVKHTRLTPFSPEHQNHTPMTLLSLLMASSPYLIKEWQINLHDLVIMGLKDPFFKNIFSQFFLHLYPHLSCLFLHGIGTDKESLFHTTVQTFSTESVVRMLSSEVYLSNSRPFMEPTIVAGKPNVAVFSLIPMLSNLFRLLISSSDLKNRAHQEVLSAFAFRNQRYRHVLHDLDFAMSCGNQYNEFFFLNGPSGKTACDTWIDILVDLHGLKPFTRIPAGRPHALYDDPTWQEAISLMIEVENVTCSIVTQSLSSKSTATVEEMLTILQTSGSNILVKLDGLYELTQDSFRLSNESPYLFEWNTSYNITSGKSVSICTPLARFLARLVNTAAACSLPFSLSALQPLSNAQMRGLCIACEYAIRNFSFASQVEIDLWKRNGLDVVNLIYNYNRASASKFFRDLDLIVVQLGVALIGPDSVLKNMFAAFECSLVESVRVRKLKYSTRAQMFAEMLRWLILIVTYLPHDLSKSAAEVAMEESKMDSPLSQTREGLEMSVDRVVAHLLLSGKNSKGKLQSVKSLLRLDTEIGDDEINASTARLCQIKSKSKEPALLEPKYPEVLMLFDPEHPYLAAKELQSANESARSYRNKPEVLTILLSKCIQRPLMKVPVLPVILPCGLPIPHPEFQIVRNLLFSTEFFQLMITALSLPSETEIVNLTLTKDENKIPKSTIVSILSRCIHLLTIQIHSLPPTEVFEKFSEEWNRIWSLLASVHRLRLLDEDQLYLQGLEWLLREYCWRSETARRCLLQLNYEGAVEIEELLTDRNKKESAKTNDAEEPKDPSMERRKLQARQKAMAAMQKNVSSFTAQMGGETFAEDNNDELQCGPECIICREMNEKPTGYLIHVQPSQVLTRAISQSLTNYTHRYLVVRPTPVYGSPTDLSAPIKPGPKFILQAGEVIYSRERSLLTWIRMASPEENWVEIYRTVANESDSKKQEQCVQLIPLELISHSRHGAVRPFVSTCGHGLHLDCWSNYLFTSMQQQQRQPSEVSAERGEIVCPFCKSVANGILPYHSHGFQELEQRSSWKFSLHGDRDQIELLFSQHQLRHDALPAFDVLVADHCLTKSQMTKRNLAFGTSGSIERNIISMRQLQALWSAIGYTLLTTITVNDDQVNQKNIIITTDQLFRCSQRANEWFPSEFNYQDMVANALRELLFSSLSTPIKLPSQCHIEELNFDAFRQLLSLQLLPVIHDSICPEDSNTLQRVFELSQFTASSSSSLWPFLRQPLFTQDLYMISIALTSNTPHLAEALDLTCLMCLARLCQLLLEPSCTGILSTLEKDDVGKKRARIPSEPSDVPFVPGELMKLRDQIYKIVGIQCHEPLDETVVIDLWVPFLQFIRALRSLIRRQVDPSAKATSCCDLEIFGLLHDCGLTELIRNYGSVDQAIGVDSPFLNEISTIWANQYRNYYQCVDQDCGVVSVSEPAEINTDQSLLPAVNSQSEWINEVADTSGDAHDNEEGDSSDEGDEDDLEDMVDVDDDLQELANDPALLLSEDIQDVDVAEMREWLLQTGIAVNSEDIQQVLGSLDRNLTKGSLLCGVDPLETPFRTIDRPSINSNPPLVGSVSGLIPYLDSSRQSRLAAPLVDYSHLGFGQRHRIKLIDLPEKYTDLYQMAKFPSLLGGGKAIDNPAICLICGKIVSAGLFFLPQIPFSSHTLGNRLGVTSRLFLSGPGECTLHASRCGAGIGLYFLVEKCETLLLYGPRAVYHPSIYLDEYGECSAGHNRPLYLSLHRYHRLQGMYANHEVAKEVIRIRLSERSVIRLNYY